MKIKEKKIIIISALITVIISMIIGDYLYKNKLTYFDNKSLFWFFSTIAQSFSALVALLGAIVLFRLEFLHNRSKEIISDIRSYMKGVGFSGVESLIDDEIVARAKKITKKDKPDKRINSLKNYYDILQKEVDDIKDLFKLYLKIVLPIIFFSIFSLISVDILISYYLDIYSVIFMLIVSLLALYLTFKLVSLMFV